MAHGKKCPNCGFPMFAQSEDDQEEGRWVVYVCQNGKTQCGTREKVFESYRM